MYKPCKERFLTIKMKRILFLVSLMISMGLSCLAQTFYCLEYHNLEGQDCIGLMTFYDEENCSMRLLTLNKKEEVVSLQNLEFLTETKGSGDEEYTAMVSTDDDTPDLAFLWSTYKSDDDIKPYISIGDADLYLADEFYEIPLSEMDEEMLSMFYDKDEEEYQDFMEGKKESRESVEEATTTLGDGEAIFTSMFQGLADARGVTVEELREQYQVQTDIDISEENPYENQGTAPDAQSTMHLVLVINSEAEDIGEACSEDLDNIKKEMTGISRGIGMNLREYVVTGKKYSRHAVESMLQSVRPSKNDVVFFLYSGHGFRFDNQTNKFPCIITSASNYDDPIEEEEYIAMQDIYDDICGKGARLNIVLSDCCNTPIGVDAICQNTSALYSRSNSNYSKKRLAGLFLQSRGRILATASSPGEPSVCDASGGFFTLAFIRSLRNEISAMNSTPVSWSSVIDNTILAAQKRSKKSGQAQNGVKSVKMDN